MKMQIAIKTVTPVCISSGEALSPVVDFVLNAEDKMLHVVDHNKLQKWLEESGDYQAVNELTKMALSKSGSIANFFESRRLDPSKFSKVSWRCNSAQELVEHSRNLVLAVNSVKGAYIPGSSIKGMLRTALIFHYIKDNGREALDEVIEANKFYTGENIFRKKGAGAEGDALRFLQVSDSDFCPLEKLRVYHLGRISRGRPIPLFVSAIPPGVSLKFQVRIDPAFEKANIPSYWKEFFQSEKNIIEALRYYSASLVEREISVLESLGSSYKELLTFYLKLQETISSTRFVFSRLGFGKTYFFNSVGVLLKDDEIAKLVRNAKRYLNGKLIFPTTRWVTMDSGFQEPLGWLVATSIIYRNA